MYNPKKYLNAMKGSIGAHPLTRWSKTPRTHIVYRYKYN